MSDHDRRLGERIKEIVARLLQALKDPRIGFITVTDVRMSGNNQHATVFFTVLPDDDETQERTLAGIRSATPLLRRELGGALGVRRVPSVEFRPDPVPARGRRIETILAEVDDRDA